MAPVSLFKMKLAGVDLGGNSHHASCYNVRKRRRGWTELVTRQRLTKFKTKFRNAPNADAAEEMDVCKDEEDERMDVQTGSDDGRMVALESVCKNILIGLVSAAVEGEFNYLFIFDYSH